jgi:microsomal dipeptidase-like Zn-dependent dipeptidase
MSQDWEGKVKGLLKAELKRRDVTYQELVEKLATLGIAETSENIANKISRGKFSAVFLVQCLEAIGCQTLRMGE